MLFVEVLRRYVDTLPSGQTGLARRHARRGASRLLRDSNAKLIEVALGVGYESEAAFSRAFKRVVGAAPGAWRRDGSTVSLPASPRQPPS